MSVAFNGSRIPLLEAPRCPLWERGDSCILEESNRIGSEVDSWSRIVGVIPTHQNQPLGESNFEALVTREEIRIRGADVASGSIGVIVGGDRQPEQEDQTRKREDEAE